MTRKTKSSIEQRQTARVEHEGRAWEITYKIFDTELRVYRVEGDVSDEDALQEALQAFAGERALALLMVNR